MNELGEAELSGIVGTTHTLPAGSAVFIEVDTRNFVNSDIERAVDFLEHQFEDTDVEVAVAPSGTIERVEVQNGIQGGEVL
jgi:hypothetical protein